MYKIVAFGEILWDVVGDRYHLGGAPLNFAAHAVQCGCSAAIISCVGQDALGDSALQEVASKKVDVSMVDRLDSKETGLVRVTLYEGTPDYDIVEDVAYDFISPKQIDSQKLAVCDAFYFGSLAQRSETSRNTLYEILNQYAFDTVCYDVNFRKENYTKSIVESSLKHTHILKLNDEEVEVLGYLLYNQNMDFYILSKQLQHDYPQIRIIIMTAGPMGCEIFQNGKVMVLPGQPVLVSDTIGAGDAYSAAFLSTYLKTGDALEAARLANKVAAFVASAPGAIPEYDMAELMDSMEQR